MNDQMLVFVMLWSSKNRPRKFLEEFSCPTHHCWSYAWASIRISLSYFIYNPTLQLYTTVYRCKPVSSCFEMLQMTKKTLRIIFTVSFCLWFFSLHGVHWSYCGAFLLMPVFFSFWHHQADMWIHETKWGIVTRTYFLEHHFGCLLIPYSL